MHNVYELSLVIQGKYYSRSQYLQFYLQFDNHLDFCLRVTVFLNIDISYNKITMISFIFQNWQLWEKRERQMSRRINIKVSLRIQIFFYLLQSYTMVDTDISFVEKNLNQTEGINPLLCKLAVIDTYYSIIIRTLPHLLSPSSPPGSLSLSFYSLTHGNSVIKDAVTCLSSSAFFSSHVR